MQGRRGGEGAGVNGQETERGLGEDGGLFYRVSVLTFNGTSSQSLVPGMLLWHTLL